MLEDVAARFLNAGEGTLVLVGYGVVALGFVVAVVLRSRSERELLRAPYFALSASLYLAVILLSGAWFLTVQAMAAGVLWILVAGVVLAIGFVGFLYGEISLARSRNAFGRSGLAFLALIPLAVLVLLFKPSRYPLAPARGRSVPLLTGGTGVVVGILCLVAARGVEYWIDERIDPFLDAAMSADESLAIKFLLRGLGLEGTLKQIASEAELPVALDEATTLSRIDADGVYLRRTYVVDEADWSMDSFFRTTVIRGICEYEVFATLLQEGATIEEVYVRPDGSEVGRETVTLRTCSI